MSDLCDKLRESALRSVCGNTDLADKTLYAIAADRIRDLEAEVDRLKAKSDEDHNDAMNVIGSLPAELLQAQQRAEAAEAKLAALPEKWIAAHGFDKYGVAAWMQAILRESEDT